MDIFKPKDFLEYKCYGNEGCSWSCADVAADANLLFNDWLNKQPKVYGAESHIVNHFLWNSIKEVEHTHTARILDIQPIQKECQHRITLETSEPFKNGKCERCGKEFVVEVRAKETRKGDWE